MPSARHAISDDTPFRLYAGQRLVLPDDIDVICCEAEAHEQVLIVFDSFYNFYRGDLRDEAAATAIDRLQQEVADRTGATIMIIDHVPWSQTRALGSVYKTAAARWLIHVARKSDAVTLNVSGNEAADQRLTLRFDPETLNLNLVAESGSDRENGAGEGDTDGLVARARAVLDAEGPARNEVLARKLVVRASVLKAALEASEGFRRGRVPGARGEFWHLVPVPDESQPPDGFTPVPVPVPSPAFMAGTGTRTTSSPDLPKPCAKCGSTERRSTRNGSLAACLACGALTNNDNDTKENK